MKESTSNLAVNCAAENLFTNHNFREQILPPAVQFPKQESRAIPFSVIPLLKQQAAGQGCLLPGQAIVKNGFSSFIKQDRNLPLAEPPVSINETSLLRLFVKNGEYVYARPNDIIMIESCDHLVKVHVAIDGNVKKAVRNNTLKDFLQLLPQNQFTRIGRFCAVNIARLSGGNCREQTFEFDFKIWVKLKRAISQSYFTSIGK